MGWVPEETGMGETNRINLETCQGKGRYAVEEIVETHGHTTWQASVPCSISIKGLGRCQNMDHLRSNSQGSLSSCLAVDLS